MSAAAERSPQGAALAYARAGWPVFPCRPGSKEPATRNGFHDASTGERQIREWWRRAPDRNVAIATGAPGPDVIDVDKYRDGSGFAAFSQLKRAGLVPDPLAVVRTPSGGFHAYYRGTEQRNGHLAAEHVDFRSQGGYVVAPPSRVGGGQYEVIRHQPGEAVFDWDAARRALRPEPQRQPPRRPGRDRDRPAGVTHLADWVAR
jgi:Bifunctional DNA primase/polymerase, N-terminal